MTAPLRLFLHACLCLAVLAAAGCQAVPGDAAVKKVVIITGEDYPAHDWRQTAPVLQRELERDPRLQVDVIEDVAFAASPALHDYDVVLIHFKNYDPGVPGRAGFDNIRRFVEAGGGLVSVHFGCGAFEEFKPEFEQLIGRTWIGINEQTQGRVHHDPYGPLLVEVVDREHAALRGMADYQTSDELYTCLEGSAPIHLLARAYSNVLHEHHPQIFVREVGRGRVFVSTLGHDIAALSNPGTAESYRRGTAWVAGLR